MRHNLDVSSAGRAEPQFYYTDTRTHGVVQTCGVVVENHARTTQIHAIIYLPTIIVGDKSNGLLGVDFGSGLSSTKSVCERLFNYCYYAFRMNLKSFGIVFYLYIYIKKQVLAD